MIAHFDPGPFREWVDRHFDTWAWLFLGCAVVALVVMAYVWGLTTGGRRAGCCQDDPTIIGGSA